MKEKAVKIALTPEQMAQLRNVTGKEVPAVKLNLEVLEARIAPKITVN